ncbi:MAG: Rpn family recombination-promoting nuclease/putative transposase [Syntrophomonadaceae bacterium]|nr:Rpn family recombination-promoting nuclease/putative transposase [Syntrophomonadaceae bacterium]
MAKTLQELSLIDDFLFCEVMKDPIAAKGLVEIILGKQIIAVQVSKTQEEVKTEPVYRGIRLDIYLEDDQNTVYNVEVQVSNTGNIPKRSRYYQSLIDYKRIPAGDPDYNKLPPSYIIFICNFDLFGQGRYKYEFEYRCLQDFSLPFGDQAIKIVLNTRGENDNEESAELIRLLKYIADSSEGSVDKAADERIRYLGEKVYEVKHSEEREANFMLLQEKMTLERQEGRLEGEKLGLRRGKREGRMEGKREKSGEIARNMLAKGLDRELIVEVTGLSEAEIEALRK